MLTGQELDLFTKGSVDPDGWGPVRRDGMNRDLSDQDLRSTIAQRNEQGKPTYLLRLEYKRRLEERRAFLSDG